MLRLPWVLAVAGVPLLLSVLLFPLVGNMATIATTATIATIATMATMATPVLGSSSASEKCKGE